jgi:hypothetical protein
MPQPIRPPRRGPRRATLTELTVRKAQPEAAAYLLWDQRQRGLALRVQPTGRKAWNLIYSRLGRPRWLYLGDVSAVGLADARLMAAEAALAAAKGGDPAAEKRAQAVLAPLPTCMRVISTSTRRSTTRVGSRLTR